MDKKRTARNMATLFLVSALLSGGAMAAQATNASSSNSYFTAAGAGYFHRADVDNSGKFAQTTIGRQNGASLPVGQGGAQGRLFKSSGSLCKQTAMTYNQGTVFASARTSGDCGVGAYYSLGLTHSWNGNGYNTNSTLRSPSLNFG
jgi:hypothetical protein